MTSPSEVVKRWDTWKILGAPYLDTEHDPEWKEAFQAEFKRRGITGFALRWRQIITALGLWWNVIWWEWGSLGKQDIIFGWASNFVVISPIVVGFMFGWIPGVLIFFVWLLMARSLLRLFFKAARIRE